MSDSVLILSILIILLIGIISIMAHRLMYKNSTVFKIVAIMSVPIMVTAILALFVGARGIIHIAWAGPVVVFVITAACITVARYIQKPLNEIMNVMKVLSTGDVEFQFNEKYRQGKGDLPLILRQVIKLTESLKKTADFAHCIGRGELDSEFELLGENDNLGKAMLNMRVDLKKAEAEKEKRRLDDERRNWVTQGLAKFADLLRSNNDNIEELSYSIISNLVKYIGANQGGVFILNDEDEQKPFLEMKACYAYERRKYINEKNIELGEGLVGTCFLEREPIYMTSIPQGYITITSGLGDEAPNALLVVPLKVNEGIYGVLEIAAFKKFENHVKDFVEKVAESIASTIASVRVNVQTNKLLEQSKLQANVLVDQEEELRLSMEEMQAVQEEMNIKQEEANRANMELTAAISKMEEMQKNLKEDKFEVDALLKTIDNLFIRIMYSTEMEMLEINDAAVDFLGESRQKLLGSNLLSRLKAEDRASFEYNWSKVLAGDTFKDEGIRKTSDGDKRLWFMYAPIKNASDKVHKVLMIGKLLDIDIN